MAEKENAAPSSSSATAAQPSTADQPGRPYYESLRATLRQTLEKKRKLDDALAAIEDNIYKLEGAYLEETANSGNMVRGFDGWVKGVQVGRGEERRAPLKGRVREEDRVFSRGSVGWMKAQEGSESNTPSLAPTPKEQFAPSLAGRGGDGGLGASKAGGGNKKRRVAEKEEEEEEEGKAVKRSKISYVRD